MVKKYWLLFFAVAVLWAGGAEGQFTVLHNFTLFSTDGWSPYGDLVSDGISLYGMTGRGGANDRGIIFKIMPDGSGYMKLHDFAVGANGSDPPGSLIYDGTFLYGMTYLGGIKDSSTIFKIKPDGSGFLKLHDFTGNPDGARTWGSLISDGTFLYGMTLQGGVNSMGTIFKIMPDGSGYLKLHDFAGTMDGKFPWGSLISDGIFLYGMSSGGGTNGAGTIFKLYTDGSGFVKLYDFAYAPDGNAPYGSLLSDGTFLYGMTTQGGTNNYGTIFKLKPDGSSYVKLLDLDSLNGIAPWGSLISDGTYLYGMTVGGGATAACGLGGCGTMFKIKPDGSGYQKLFDFDAAPPYGDNPYGSLISDGTFLYGMTSTAGSGLYPSGTIFKYDLRVGIDEASASNTISLYPNPSVGGEFTISTSLNAGVSGLKFNVGTVEVYDVVGEKVYSTSLHSQMSTVTCQLSAGVYFVKITDGETAVTKKLVVE